MSRPTEQTSHQVMYGLYYPAVLGAAITALAYRMTQYRSVDEVIRASDLQLCVLAVVLFSASFAAADTPERYPRTAVLLDAIEVVLMGVVFFSLDIFTGDRRAANPRIGMGNLFLVEITIVQWLWRSTTGLPVEQLHVYMRLALVMLLWQWCMVPRGSSIRVMLVAGAIAIVVGYANRRSLGYRGS